MKPETSVSASSLYSVWFVSCCEPDQLLNLSATVQIQQDVLVVEAANDHDALVKAEKLLRLRCGFRTIVTKVMDRAELLRAVAVLDLVAAGKLEAASPADASHLDWAERFVYNDYTLTSSS